MDQKKGHIQEEKFKHGYDWWRNNSLKKKSHNTNCGKKHFCYI